MGKYVGIGNWRRIVVHGLFAGAVFISGETRAQGWKLATNLTLKAGLTLKETHDNNVFILDTAPNPAVTPPAGFTISEPKKESFITTVTPSVTLDYRPCAAFAATLSYAPEIATYHSAPSEDYVAHRGAINFSGKIKDVSYESLNSVTWIDGSDLGPVTIRPGDCRAVGGIPLRDRRDALIFKDGFKLTIPAGKWFFRPVVSAYVHDFKTKQFANTNSSQFIYDNFIDRWELNGGLDIGYEAFTKTKLVVGYRYGHQHQGDLRGTPSRYSNNYQRFLFGVEGSPASWVKLAVLAGPDVRDWQNNPVSTFDRDEVLWFVDAAVTLLPTKADTVTLKATRFEQPAFTSQSMYEDIKYDFSWRHKFTDKFTAGAGFTLYNGDWQSPWHRDDWIYTPSLMASYAFNTHVSAEASWSYDWVENQVPTTAPGATYANGREYTRHLVSLAVKYNF